MAELATRLDQREWYRDGRGPRYKQLCRHISALVTSGALAAEDQLPSEREIAEIADVSSFARHTEPLRSDLAWQWLT